MESYEKKHSAAVRELGAECAVLLRSSGAFPLDAAGEIALYGSGARHTVKGGTGSGEVNSRYYVSVEQGLKEAGFTVTTGDWMERYDEIVRDAHRNFIQQVKQRAKENHTLAILEGMGAVMPEPEYRLSLQGSGNTAVYVLSRISGEGSDRNPVPGDILLSETERRDILFLQEKYEKFLLVLNVGGVVDLSPLSAVENILLLGQLGVETGNVLADILLGKSYPSGKLTTTWSAWPDYCGVGEFGDINDTAYKEGIYVGYRYFDSIGKKALFPFGFGLSYTSFLVEAVGVRTEGETVRLEAKATNTGMRPGKEVLQVYVSVPAARLDQPYQTLAAFAKTRELQPDESEELTLCFRLPEIASYDEEESAWVLEHGDYVLRLGTSSVNADPVAVLRLDDDVMTKKVRRCGGKPDFDDWKPANRETTASPKVQVFHIPATAIAAETTRYDLLYPMEPEVKKLTDEELAYMNVGRFDPRAGVMSVIGNAGKSVAGAAGETSDVSHKFPAVVMADGPAGLRLSQKYTVDQKGGRALGDTLPASMAELLPAPAMWFIRHFNGGGKIKGAVYEQYATAIPIGTAIAQSWNLQVAEICGDIVGDEMERFGVHLWLAPALNIHRDIRCGRNFEYFSEDPLISGKFAAAITRGVQKHSGCGATVKHFAANNQENNRYNSNSKVSERALREIYLRGFGICIRESQPHALMTSYNLLNGLHTSERRDLIEDILRCEFQYGGVVMTDWIVNGGTLNKASIHPAPRADKIAAAGNDLTMPGSKNDWKNILKGLKNGGVSRKQLQINASRILRLAKKLTGKMC